MASVQLDGGVAETGKLHYQTIGYPSSSIVNATTFIPVGGDYIIPVLVININASLSIFYLDMWTHDYTGGKFTVTFLYR